MDLQRQTLAELSRLLTSMEDKIDKALQLKNAVAPSLPTTNIVAVPNPLPLTTQPTGYPSCFTSVHFDLLSRFSPMPIPTSTPVLNPLQPPYIPPQSPSVPSSYPSPTPPSDHFPISFPSDSSPLAAPPLQTRSIPLDFPCFEDIVTREIPLEPSEIEDPQGSLAKLTQTTSVSAHQQIHFEPLADQTFGALPDLFVSCSVFYLQPSLRCEVAALHPTTMVRVVGLACFQEAKPVETRRFQPRSLPSRPPPLSSLTAQALLPPPLSLRIPNKGLTLVDTQLRRQKGLCYTWDNKFAQHRCKPLFLLEYDEESNGPNAVMSPKDIGVLVYRDDSSMAIQRVAFLITTGVETTSDEHILLNPQGRSNLLQSATQNMIRVLNGHFTKFRIAETLEILLL